MISCRTNFLDSYGLIRDSVSSPIPDVPTFIANNFLYEGNLLDTPVPPPFKQFWVEHSFPASSGVRGVLSYIESHKKKSGGWIIDIYPVIKTSSVTSLQPYLKIRIDLDEYGYWSGEKQASVCSSLGYEFIKILKNLYGIDDKRIINRLINVTISPIANLHNEETVVNKTSPNRQQLRKLERKCGLKSSEHYVITIGKKNQKSSTYSSNGNPQNNKRCHMVRGHFRFYSPERPLFGRVSGWIWVPEHERGNPQLGTITKDYLIEEDN